MKGFKGAAFCCGQTGAKVCLASEVTGQGGGAIDASVGGSSTE